MAAAAAPSSSSATAAHPAPSPAPLSTPQLLWSHPVQTPSQLCLQLGFATDLIRWKFHKIVEISANLPIAAHAHFG